LPVYFQVHHAGVEDEYKNHHTFRPFRISLRYFFGAPLLSALVFVVLFAQFEPLLHRLDVAVPVYKRFKGLYFTHLYWLTAVLPQEVHAFVTFQISDQLFLFSMLQSFVTATLMGLIVSRVYGADIAKHRMD
jgi:hypothetical protein